MQPQGTRVMLCAFIFNGTSGRGFKLGTRPRIFAAFDLYKVDMAVLDAQFIKLPNWSCSASYFIITSHTRFTRFTRIRPSVKKCDC
eukprot:1091389-Pelagomonas_calceolata.AAC.1